MTKYLAILVVAIGLVSLMATGATAAPVHAGGNVAVSSGTPHSGGGSPTTPPEAAVSDGVTGSTWHAAPGNTCGGCQWQLDLGQDWPITEVHWYNYNNTQNSALVSTVAFASEAEATGTLGSLTGFSNLTTLNHTVFSTSQEIFSVTDTARYVEVTFVQNNGGGLSGFADVQFEVPEPTSLMLALGGVIGTFALWRRYRGDG